CARFTFSPTSWNDAFDFW
nr:immunoglobulin heavy chain junction region [Macaca mulatta]